MGRSLSAVRDVLLHVEREFAAADGPREITAAEVASGCSFSDVSYAIFVLLDGGYLYGSWDPFAAEPRPAVVRGITAAGREFLQLFRKEESWSLALLLISERASLDLMVH